VASPDRTLNGQDTSGLIDWGTDAWYVSGPLGPFTGNSIGLNGPTARSANFALVSPRRVVGLDAYNGGSGSSTVTLSCAGLPSATFSVPRGQVVTLNTGWTASCSDVTVSASNGWDTSFNNVVLQEDFD
jgi:hypothetical protein